MRIINFYIIILFLNACCSSNTNTCEDNEIRYGIDCIKINNNIFYESKVDFYCFNESILIGLDAKNKTLNPFYINDYNPVNSNILSARGSINYAQNLLFMGFNVECSINGQDLVTWFIIEDKSQFDLMPDKIKAKVMLKESIDFESNTIEEMEIELRRR